MPQRSYVEPWLHQFPRLTASAMFESNGKSGTHPSVLGGLLLGLAIGAYLFWIGQADRCLKGCTPEQSRNVRLLRMFQSVATALTRIRLGVWKAIPAGMRTKTFQFVGRRFRSEQGHKVFLLRHSNCSERIRWALELAGEKYQEVPVAIFAERSSAEYHSQGASRRLPLVYPVDGHGEAMDSAALMEYLSNPRWREWMYPEGAMEMEGAFERDLALPAMHVAYAYLFQKEIKKEMFDMFSQGLPLWQSLLVPTLGAGVAFKMQERFRLCDAEKILANLLSIDRAFGLVESALRDGRQYLCGETISTADITFAALAFPVLLPEETSEIFVAYDPRSLPRGYVETIKRLRARDAGKFALRLYRNKRLRDVRVKATHRRGRSFTVKKNVNSPTHPLHAAKGRRRATATAAITAASKDVPNFPQSQPEGNSSGRRTTITLGKSHVFFK